MSILVVKDLVKSFGSFTAVKKITKLKISIVACKPLKTMVGDDGLEPPTFSV